MSFSDHDQALIQAYCEAYTASGGEFLSDSEEEVLDILRAHGANTERMAAIVARGQAQADLEAEADGGYD